MIQGHNGESRQTPVTGQIVVHDGLVLVDGQGFLQGLGSPDSGVRSRL